MNLKPFNLLVLRIDLNKNAYTEKLPFFSILRNVIRESFSSWKYDRHICQGFFRLHNTDWAAAAAWWMTLVKIVSASILHLGNGDNWYHRDTVNFDDISCKLLLSDLNLFLIPIKVMTMHGNDNVTMLQCYNVTDDIKPLQILSSSLPLSSPSSSWWSASTGGTKNILLLGKLKKLDIVRTRGEQNHNIRPSS